MRNLKEPDLEYENADPVKRHRLWRFDNNWGVSMAQGPNIRGGNEKDKWSFAVVTFPGPPIDRYDLNYANPITEGDVLHNISYEQATSLAKLVQNFPQWVTCHDSMTH